MTALEVVAVDRVRGLSMRDLETLFGQDARSIVRWWIRPGLLVGRRWSGRGRSPCWWFDESEIERFVRTSSWAYDADRMQPGHRLTMLARLIQRAQRQADDGSQWCTAADGSGDRASCEARNGL